VGIRKSSGQFKQCGRSVKKFANGRSWRILKAQEIMSTQLEQMCFSFRTLFYKLKTNPL